MAWGISVPASKKGMLIADPEYAITCVSVSVDSPDERGTRVLTVRLTGATRERILGCVGAKDDFTTEEEGNDLVVRTLLLRPEDSYVVKGVKNSDVARCSAT